MQRHIPIIKLLLAGGCDPNITCGGKVPLHYVAPAPATSTTMEIVRLLLDAGAEPASWVQSPFDLALETGNEPFVDYVFQHYVFDTEVILDMVDKIAGQHKGLASFLLKKIDLDHTINFGTGARSKLLCVAVAGGFEDLLERLLSTRTSVLSNWNCNCGHRDIMALAVASGNIKMIELLLYYGESLYDAVTYPAVIIEKDTNGNWDPDDCPSSMILALDRGHDDVVKYIINQGFDVVFASQHGKDLFNRALYLGKVEILQMLFETSAPSIEDIAFSEDGLSIQLAVLGGEAAFRLLLQRGVRLQPDCVGHSRALAYAAVLANVPILKMFLDAGFSLDVQGEFGLSFALDGSRGGTLLALAAQAKDRDAAQAAVNFLLERGAQLNQPGSSRNYTPLLCTVSGVARNYVWNIKWFIGKIRKTEADEVQREIVREELFETTDRGVLATKLLLEKGADPLFCNGSGESALAVAAGKNDIGTVKMLLKYVDQDVPISTIRSHVMAAMDPSDDYHGILGRWKVKPSLGIQETLWNYYWRKAYPASE
ncbi:hypothetical protein N7519_009774 [Penicillium mononematosum]|uniref:uncharacterized protein n=1 Tax=Penicillium mononematosum TaxID=268346 RepID=UPI00254865AE|nr:uncharacterized protein N7519_009774 [Penicillium mononematosum]KAJ6179313.1 hypothetical protein N7519_009774 [Penicillium mononematosum]